MKEHNYGGPFCDLGVHLIDSLLWVVGDKKVEAVSGNAYTKIANQGEDILLSIAVCAIKDAFRVQRKDMSISSLLAEILSDKDYYGENGGVTFSGGEPLAQRVSVRNN